LLEHGLMTSQGLTPSANVSSQDQATSSSPMVSADIETSNDAVAAAAESHSAPAPAVPDQNAATEFAAT
jgi:hypothetical protein